MGLFKKRYKYYVSFEYFKSQPGRGLGSTVVEGPKIKGMGDIEAIEDSIARKVGAEKVALRNFILIK